LEQLAYFLQKVAFESVPVYSHWYFGSAASVNLSAQHYLEASAVALSFLQQEVDCQLLPQVVPQQYFVLEEEGIRQQLAQRWVLLR
jgi:hypothetical protein